MLRLLSATRRLAPSGNPTGIPVGIPGTVRAFTTTPAAAAAAAAARAPPAATSAAPTLIQEVLSAAAADRPLKNAAKFCTPGPVGPAAARSILWSTAELSGHASALAAGLVEAGFAPGDRLVTLLPPGAPEALVTALAAAAARLALVPVTPPAGGVVNVGLVADAVRRSGAVGAVVWHGFALGEGADPAGADCDADASAEATVVRSLVGAAVARADAAGAAGWVRSTGRPLPRLADLPSLRMVIHTGPGSVRGAVAFRNLLVYDPAPGPQLLGAAAADDPLLLPAASSAVVTNGEVVARGVAAAARLGLGGDHAEVAGKVVLPLAEAAPGDALAVVVAALLRETLVVSPSYLPDAEAAGRIAKEEGAVVA